MKNVLKDLRVLEHEEKAVLINQESKSWIKINKSLYEKYIDKELDENNMLLKIVNKYMFDYENNNDSQLSINTVYFTVTRKCNLACEFCSMRSNPYVDTSENMSLDTIKEKVIPVLKLIDINRIVITGGEPVTRKDLIQLIDLINEELDVGITFQTNGLLLDENIIKSLQGKINQIDISIENIFDDSDLFNKMINILENMV